MSENNYTEKRVRAITALGIRICARLNEEILKLGFGVGAIPAVHWEAADFTLKRDPYSGEESVEGIWHDADGQRIGMILFHAGGNFFSEYDVARPHPGNERWFVEAVSAWGSGDILKAEARLLPALIEA